VLDRHRQQITDWLDGDRPLRLSKVQLADRGEDALPLGDMSGGHLGQEVGL
jgi:hypothetical protein